MSPTALRVDWKLVEYFNRCTDEEARAVLRGEGPMAANYLDENDRLEEAGRILAGKTMLIPTLAHVEALAQLVREARGLLKGDTDVDLRDWLEAAEKVL